MSGLQESLLTPPGAQCTGAHQSGCRQSSPAPVTAAFESEVDASLPPKKCDGANQFQSGRWIGAAQPLSARQKVNGTEDHQLDDGGAGGGEFRRSMQPAPRTGAVTGGVGGGLSRPLGGALSLNHLKFAAAALSARVKLGLTHKLNEFYRQCELNMLKSKRKPSYYGMIETVGLDCCRTRHRNQGLKKKPHL